MANKPLNSINFGGSNTYTVPNPVSKTSAMTQQVGVDSDGKLWTAPSSGGGSGGTSGNYVPLNQGYSNSGKFLVVGSDGNVTTMTLQAWQGGSY